MKKQKKLMSMQLLVLSSLVWHNKFVVHYPSFCALPNNIFSSYQNQSWAAQVVAGQSSAVVRWLCC
jgi:hypothetical protein